MATILQALTFNLASPIDATQTSIPVRNLKDSRGNPITAMIGSIIFATLEPRSSANQEIISFTGITDNGNGVVTLTGVTRNLDPRPPYASLGGLVPHSNNAEGILANNPPFYNDFLRQDSDVTITGDYKFPTPTDPQNAATKAFVEALAFFGAGDASEVSKGLTRLSQSPNVVLGNPTISIATPAVVTLNTHGLTVNDTVVFSTTGALPTGITAGVTYYVLSTGLTANTFQISTAPAGAAVNTSGSQSGTHTLTKTTPVAVSVLDPRLPTTDEKAAMGGAAGVPSALNKFLTQSNFFVNEDQSQLTQNADGEFGEANATTRKNQIVQSIVAGNTSMRGVRLYKRANTGTFTGTVTIALKSDNAGNPDATLASVTFTNAEWNSIAVGEFEAIFSTEYASMVVGATYWLVASTSTADNANHPNLGANTAGGYTSGLTKYWNVTDGFVTLTGYDLYFVTLNGVTGKLVGQLRQFLTHSATWVKPVGAKFVEVFLIGGGGGGGGGSADNASTFGSGGAGGAGGGFSYQKFLADTLPASIAVTVGAGGIAGIGAATTNTAGGAGGAGGNTSFGSFLIATGATGGGGGLVNGSAPTASVAGQGSLYDGSLQSVSVKVIAPTGGGQGGSGNAGNGGAGGARQTTNVLAGGTGGGGNNPGPGAAGGNGNTFDVRECVGGTGGGGGGGGAGNNNSTATGGNGGLYGGGGGGGGSAYNQGANGGAGAQGCALIITYF